MTASHFLSYLATRHRNGFNLNFADGHVDHYKFRDPTQPVPPVPADISPANSDWAWLKSVTTVPSGPVALNGNLMPRIKSF